MSIIESERLVLRPAVLADAAFMLQLMNEPGWLLNIGDRGVRTVPAAEAYITRALLPTWAEHGYGASMVVPRGASEPVGLCGLFRREPLPEPDLGFAFLEAAWGQGFAREAARAVLRDAAERHGLRRILAVTTEANLRSIRLLEALGFAPEAPVVLDGKRAESLLFSKDIGPDAERARPT